MRIGLPPLHVRDAGVGGRFRPRHHAARDIGESPRVSRSGFSTAAVKPGGFREDGPKAVRGNLPSGRLRQLAELD